MKIFKIVLVIVIILGLSFVGYKGYLAYQKWEANKYSEISILKANQNMFLQKITDLSTTLTKVVNDTAKVTTIPKSDNTYESLKNEVIELKKNGDANKDEINSLKEKLSEQRKAFLASDDTILIKDKNDETFLLYRDESGNLQPASDNIEKIIEHKDVSNVPILAEEELANKKTSLKLKVGGYYSFDNSYGVIISKGIFSMKSYNLNASLLLSDFDDFKFAVGADIGYRINDNLELGIGYDTSKEYYIKLQYQF